MTDVNNEMWQKWHVLLAEGSLKNQAVVCLISLLSATIRNNIPDKGCSISLGSGVKMMKMIWNRTVADL